MSELFEAIETVIINQWKWVLLLILGIYLWFSGLILPVIRELIPFGAVVFLGVIAWRFWIHYIRADFISGIDYVVLEIVPPREVLRSPKAMELFLTNALYHFSNKGGKEEFWQGAVWFWYSLEIASIDGQVHFYIRTPTRVQSMIETQMYAQYPQAQVKVVEDYTLSVDEISEKSAWMGWGCEFKLAKPEAYPLRTYVDYGLDKDPKEEFKVDPISPVVELFGSLQKGEQMWVQIIITPSKKKFHNHGTGGYHDWTEETRIQIKKLLLPYTNVKENGSVEIRAPGFLDTVTKSMSAKATKIGFDTGIRVMYVAKKEAYNMSNRRNLRLIFRQYTNPDSNGLERHNSTQADALGSSIRSLSQEKVIILANRMLNEYRDRSFFYDTMRQKLFNNSTITKPLLYLVKPFFLPYLQGSTFVLNVEELATLWHFPGQILKVPTLERIESKEASPPTNLPT